MNILRTLESNGRQLETTEMATEKCVMPQSHMAYTAAKVRKQEICY